MIPKRPQKYKLKSLNQIIKKIGYPSRPLQLDGKQKVRTE